MSGNKEEGRGKWRERERGGEGGGELVEAGEWGGCQVQVERETHPAVVYTLTK